MTYRALTHGTFCKTLPPSRGGRVRQSLPWTLALRVRQTLREIIKEQHLKELEVILDQNPHGRVEDTRTGGFKWLSPVYIITKYRAWTWTHISQLPVWSSFHTHLLSYGSMETAPDYKSQIVANFTLITRSEEYNSREKVRHSRTQSHVHYIGLYCCCKKLPQTEWFKTQIYYHIVL